MARTQQKAWRGETRKLAWQTDSWEEGKERRRVKRENQEWRELCGREQEERVNCTCVGIFSALKPSGQS